jgi:hypothetical protein
MRIFSRLAILTPACLYVLLAQDALPQPVQDTTGTQPAQQRPPDATTPNGAVGAQPPNAIDKRVFGVIPNNRTASGTVPYAPISAKQKILIGLKDSFDWPAYLTGGLFAGLYQLENSNPSFGQGAAGYFRRFGTASADQVIGNMMTEGFVPAAFHQDPRYFQLGPGGGTKKHRLWHALSSIMATQMDSGHKTFNFSEWGGNAVAVAISNAYYPDSRTASDNVQKLLIAVGTDTFSNVMKEFWPDVKSWWKHKVGGAAAPLTAAH